MQPFLCINVFLKIFPFLLQIRTRKFSIHLLRKASYTLHAHTKRYLFSRFFVFLFTYFRCITTINPFVFMAHVILDSNNFWTKWNQLIHFFFVQYFVSMKRKRRRTKITTAEIEMRNAFALQSFYVSAIFGIKVKVLNKIYTLIQTNGLNRKFCVQLHVEINKNFEFTIKMFFYLFF